MNKTAVVLLAIIAVASVVSGYAYTNYFAIDQANVDITDSNVTIHDSTITFGENNTFVRPDSNSTFEPPSDIAPKFKPYPTPSPSPEPLPYKFVVYEWYLKADQINNVTWLSAIIYGEYNPSKSWIANYFEHLAKQSTKPTETAPWMLEVYLFVTADFNANTGWTKATYEYAEYNGKVSFYHIEFALTNQMKITDWTKNFVK